LQKMEEMRSLDVDRSLRKLDLRYERKKQRIQRKMCEVK
jgi:hypothetical protein